MKRVGLGAGPAAAGGQPAGHPEVPAGPAPAALRGGRDGHGGHRRAHPGGDRRRGAGQRWRQVSTGDSDRVSAGRRASRSAGAAAVRASLVGDDVLGELPGAGSAAPPGSPCCTAAACAPTPSGRARRCAAPASAVAARSRCPTPRRASTSTSPPRCWDALGAAAFTRTDAVVGVGGGAVTDLAGFVAACWLRGVRWVQVPTTLLGMVDAAVGGKTGINTAAGKNLVGAFHPPAGVLCDLATLDDACPPADLRRRAGRGGQVRVHRRPGDPRPDRGRPGRRARPGRRRCCASWSSGRSGSRPSVVAADLRESGLREILNYGHTLGHAIEQVEGYRWRHGARGLASAWSTRPRWPGSPAGSTRPTRRPAPRRADRARPAGRLPRPTPGRELLAAMRVDKKARGADAALRACWTGWPARHPGRPARRPAVEQAYAAVTLILFLTAPSRHHRSVENVTTPSATTTPWGRACVRISRSSPPPPSSAGLSRLPSDRLFRVGARRRCLLRGRTCVGSRRRVVAQLIPS